MQNLTYSSSSFRKIKDASKTKKEIIPIVAFCETTNTSLNHVQFQDVPEH